MARHMPVIHVQPHNLAEACDMLGLDPVTGMPLGRGLSKEDQPARWEDDGYVSDSSFDAEWDEITGFRAASVPKANGSDGTGSRSSQTAGQDPRIKEQILPQIQKKLWSAQSVSVDTKSVSKVAGNLLDLMPDAAKALLAVPVRVYKELSDKQIPK